MFLIKSFLIYKISYRLLYLPKILINYCLEKFNIFIIWRKGKAIGDQVLMSGFARALKLKYNSRIIVITSYPDILRLSKWISICIDINRIFIWKITYHILNSLEGKRIILYNFPYKKYGYNGFLDAYKKGLYEKLNRPPIWLAHVAHRFNKEIFKNFNCGLSTSKNKEAQIIISEIKKKYPNKKIGIINPIGKKSFISSKVLSFKKFEKVIELTKNKIAWIQVGEKNSLKLKYCSSYQTGRSLIFLVDIIANSDLVFANEGLLNHITSSFPNINSYVAFSYYHPKQFYTYPNTITVGNPYPNNKKFESINWNNPDKIEKNLLAIETKTIAEEILKNEQKEK